MFQTEKPSSGEHKNGRIHVHIFSFPYKALLELEFIYTLWFQHSLISWIWKYYIYTVVVGTIQVIKLSSFFSPYIKVFTYLQNRRSKHINNPLGLIQIIT